MIGTGGDGIVNFGGMGGSWGGRFGTGGAGGISSSEYLAVDSLSTMSAGRFFFSELSTL